METPETKLNQDLPVPLTDASIEFWPLRLRGDIRTDETILDAARRAGAPIGNSCGATGACSRCAVRILSGQENIPEMNRIEQDLWSRGKLAEGDRLACQVVPRGSCRVTTGYWG